ncbi:AAA family ATPase [Streptomyces rubiginosohelvolus]|uniref:AAA family ATPase n=1 Tax=Streptomyces rubiginosohelvolus TaxID=67362 RepID=UPI00380411B6
MRLPLIKKVNLSHFSLYRNKTENTVQFGDGVFCLVGANGLGKSTFLSVINYALTGIVAAPDQKILSISEYYRNSLPYSGEYFTGRVHQRDRDSAEVTLEFSVGEHEYKVTRGFFSPQALQRLVISGPGVSVEKHANPEDVDAGTELHELYTSLILQHTGLARFEQLVFLQLFLLTFDERRHLLFWDTEVARFALYLVFGLDPAQADQAGEWQRKADRLESQARNAQYAATTARERRAELLARADSPFEVNEDLEERLQLLQQHKDDLETRVDEKGAQEKDAKLAVSTAVANHHSLSVEYSRLFGERLSPHVRPMQHPLIARLLHENECGVCGAKEVDVSPVRAQLDSGDCPLCRTGVSEAVDEDQTFVDLEVLDERLRKAGELVQDRQDTLDRITRELAALRVEYLSAGEELAQFEEVNSSYISRKDEIKAQSGLIALAQELEAQQNDAARRRDDFRHRRDEYKALLEPLQRELAEKYAIAEREFVPKFQSLAHAFLGLDLSLVLEQRARGPQLVVSIDGHERRESNQLSESQRYFIDIALRMALAEFMVGEEGTACLFVDTPEGSLDIAYERRAGEMFGEFVARGNRLVMTANLNSSRLVLELARTCRRQLMHVERMTNWAVLSEVQADAEDLFDESYRAIQDSLDGDGLW